MMLRLLTVLVIAFLFAGCVAKKDYAPITCFNPAKDCWNSHIPICQGTPSNKSISLTGHSCLPWNNLSSSESLYYEPNSACRTGNDDKNETMFVPSCYISESPRTKEACYKPCLWDAQMSEMMVRRRLSLQLLSAVTANDRGAVKRLLEEGADPEIEDTGRNTPLLLAMYKQNWPIMKQLMKYNASINVKNRKVNATLLHMSISSNMPYVAKTLIENGADVNAKLWDGFSVLHSATLYQQSRIAKLLIQYGADPDAIYFGGGPRGTPLNFAIMRGLIDVSRELIVDGGSIESRYKPLGDTPLHLAVKEDREQQVKLLLEAGAHVDFTFDDGITALHYAAEHNVPRIAKHLLQRGADANATTNATRETPLHCAARNGSIDMIRLLIDNGTDIGAKTTGPDSGNTALHTAAYFGQPGSITTLVIAGLSVNEVNDVGDTPLHVASRRGEGSAVVTLIRMGANTAAGNNMGETPIDVALNMDSATWLHPRHDDTIGYAQCFKDFGEQRTLTHKFEDFSSSGLLPSNCVQGCEVEGFHYAGLRPSRTTSRSYETSNSIDCYCGLDLAVAKRRKYRNYCSTRCPDSTELACGGRKTMSIYFTKHAKLSCPDPGWFQIDKGGPFCYQHFDERLSFDEAENECDKFGGNLLSVWNEDENAIPRTILGSTHYVSPTLWIGLRNDQVSGEYIWTDGSGVVYHNFSDAKIPYSRTKACTLAGFQTGGHRSGKIVEWRIAECNEKHSYICKVLAKSSPKEDTTDCFAHDEFPLYLMILICAGVGVALLLAALVTYTVFIKANQVKIADDDRRKSIIPVPAIKGKRELKRAATEFMCDVDVSGVKEIVKAKTSISRIFWVLILSVLVVLMIYQSAVLIMQYYGEVTVSDVYMDALEGQEGEQFAKITICANALGGWARSSVRNDGNPRHVGDYYYDQNKTVRQYLAGNFRMFKDKEPDVDVDLLQSLIRYDMELTGLPTLSEFYAQIWGIEPVGSTSFTTNPFIVKQTGARRPLICRVAKSNGCSARYGCPFSFKLDIDWDLFFDSLSQNMPTVYELLFSPYYTEDIGLAEQAFQSHQGLVSLLAFVVDRADPRKARYFKTDIHLEGTKYIYEDKRREPCTESPPGAVLPNWVKGKSCSCFETRKQTYGNCSDDALYNANLAGRYPVCDRWDVEEEWLDTVPRCWIEQCLISCSEDRHCLSWSVKPVSIRRREIKKNPGEDPEMSDLLGDKSAVRASVNLPDEVIVVEEKFLQTIESFLSGIGGIWGFYLGCSFVSLAHIVWSLFGVVFETETPDERLQSMIRTEVENVMSELSARSPKDTTASTFVFDTNGSL